MKCWKLFGKDATLDNIEVELIPPGHSSETRTRKLAEWMKVDSSHTDYDQIQQARQKQRYKEIPCHRCKVPVREEHVCQIFELICVRNQYTTLNKEE